MLIVATGNTTHNLRAAFRGGYDTLPREVTDFTAWLHDALLRKDHEAVRKWMDAPHARWNHPTPEHFLPLFVALGAAGPEAAAVRLHDSVDFGVLAMDSYKFT